MSGATSYAFVDAWLPRLFCGTWDFNLDVRALETGSGATLSVKPALQHAPVRGERPDQPAVIGAGNAATSAGILHYVESPASLEYKGLFRFGIGYWLSALGSVPFGRAEVILTASWRPLGKLLPAEEVVVNPTNDSTEWSIFPLNRGKPIPARSLDLANAIVIGQGNLTSTMEYWLYVRAFNDPMARGDWTSMALGSNGPQTPSVGNFEVNLGNVAFPAGISLSSYQWVELALGVRRASGNNSRCIFHVLPSVKYT